MRKLLVFSAICLGLSALLWVALMRVYDAREKGRMERAANLEVAEIARHVALPEYRRLPTIDSMKVGETAYVEPESMVADSHGWLFLQANRATQKKKTEKATMAVTRTDAGYTVDICDLPDAKWAVPQRDSNSKHRDGYPRVPVTELRHQLFSGWDLSTKW